MAFGWDGNGNWDSELFPIQDRDDNIPISATKFNQLIQQNLKQSFPQCMTIDSQTKPVANVDISNFKVINVADGVLPKDAVNKGQLDSVESTLDGKIDINTTNIATNTINIAANTLKGQETTLWTGNATSGTISLSQTIDNFNKLHFIAVDNATGRISTQVSIPVSEYKLTNSSYIVYHNMSNAATTRVIGHYRATDTSFTITEVGGGRMIKVIGIK